MALITASNLEKSFGGDLLFSRLSFAVDKSDRVGLVGRNGEGKTTLLKILLDQEEPSGGQLNLQKNLRIGHLPQVPPTLDDRPLWDFMLEVFSDVFDMEKQMDELAAAMAEPNCPQSSIDRYTKLQHEFELRGGYIIDTKIHTILSGLGFDKAQHKMPLSKFSGGWRTRAYLARLLLEEPDILLLDEPTNHLDLTATRWLEGFLSSWPKALLVVSHDRFFLNKLCNRIWEMSDGAVESFKGNYEAFLTQRQARFEERMKTWESQQEYIKETEAFIRQHIAGQRTKEAQGRRKHLERFLKEEAIQKPKRFRNIKIKFQPVERSGDMVMHARGLQVGYDGNPLAEIPNLELQRNHRLGIIGGNGTGKTTLMKTILDELPAIAGTIRFGSKVEPGYLSQTHDDLNHDGNALDAIREAQTIPNDASARNLLGSLLFSGDDVFKSVSDLSGGERARLAIARLALRGANLLMLDEPTNHLDIQSQEVLQDILKEYPGTLVFISHDRYLVQNLATHLLVFEEDEVVFIEGSWEDYQRKKQEPTPQPKGPQNQKTAVAPAPVNDYKEEKRRQNEIRRQKKRFDDIEKLIHKLEDNKGELETGIGQAGEAQDMDKLLKLTTDLQALTDELTELYSEWEELAEVVEE